MTSPQDIERKFTQTRNEFDDVYKLLDKTNDTVNKIAENQEEHGRQLADLKEDHGRKLAEILHTVEMHTTDLSLAAHRADNWSHKLRRMEDNQRTHSERLDRSDHKLDQILGLLRQRE